MSPLTKKLLSFFIFCSGILFCLYNLLQGYYGLPEYYDDAYYYIQSAKNHALYGFYSIDTMNPTNGFHPLWMGLITIFFEWGGINLSKVEQIFGVKIIEMAVYLLALSSSVYLYNKESKYQNLFLGASFLLVALPGLSLWGKGMEATISCFWAIWLVYFMINERYVALAWVMPFLFLSRLDSALYVITPCLIYIWYKQRSLKLPMLVLIPTFATGLVYIVGNYFFYDELLPISGQLKSSFPWPHLQWTQIFDPMVLNYQIGSIKSGLRYLLLIPNMTFLFVGSLLIVSTVLWKRQRDLYFLIWILLALLMGLLLFQKWTKGIEVWYFALPYLFLSMLGMQLAIDFIRNRVVIIAIAIITFISAGYYGVKSLSMKTPEYNLEKMWYNLPESSVLACSDMGYISFWGPNRVVNLDGLINNREYQQYLRDGNLTGYLKKNGVDYLLVGLWDQNPKWQLGRETEKAYQHRVCPEAFYNSEYAYDFYMYSYLYGTFSEKLRLTQEQEVLRTPVAKDGALSARILIFDVRGLKQDKQKE